MIQAAEKPRRIAIVAHSVRTAGGLSFARNLTAAIDRVAPQHAYLHVVPAGGGYEEVAFVGRCHEVVTYEHSGGLPGRWFFDAFRLPAIVRRFAPDVTLVLGNTAVVGDVGPQAILSQDPHLFYPVEHYRREMLRGKLLKSYLRRRFRRDLGRVQLVFCQTKVIESRLRATYGYCEEVELTGNAVSTAVLSAADCSGVPPQLAASPKKTKLLCLTRYYAHKNIELIVEAFRRHRDALGGVAVVTTIAADQHPNAARLLSMIRRAGLEGSVINVGPVRQEDLSALYKHCDALLLPTLLESFSQAYVEAMHFGLPILTSDLDFAREICGDAALYFDPWSADSLKDALLRFAADPRVAEDLAAGGRSRLAGMSTSWESIARRIMERLLTICPRPLEAHGAHRHVMRERRVRHSASPNSTEEQ